MNHFMQVEHGLTLSRVCMSDGWQGADLLPMQCPCAMRAGMSRWFFLEKNFRSRAQLQDFERVDTKWNHAGRHTWSIGRKRRRISRRA